MRKSEIALSSQHTLNDESGIETALCQYTRLDAVSTLAEWTSR